MPGPSGGRPRNSRRRLKAVDSRRTEWRQAANSQTKAEGQREDDVQNSWTNKGEKGHK